MRKMKDSGIAWIGEIPEGWRLSSVRRIFTIGRGRVIAQTELVSDGLYPVYSSQTKSNGCMGYINTYDFDVAQLTWTTDGANAGTVFMREGKYNCTNVCGTLKPKDELLNLHYQKYALEFISTYHKRADINGYKIMNNEMAEIITIIPPLREQQKIADFLDKKCAEIDKLIELQDSMIDKLKEYKQSVITQAVTKGLNPDVPMKDSGIEWIGKVPEGWECCRIKNIAYFNPITEIDQGKDVVSYAPMDCVKDGWLIHNEININNVSTGLTLFQENDIVMAKVTPCFENGNIAIATELKNGIAYGSSELFVFRSKNTYNKWLFYFLRNNIFKQRASSTMTGTGGLKRVSPKFVSDYPLAIPPIKEQQQIADYLDKKCVEIDDLIKLKEQKIEKLKEYKKSLIYEYVTGKKEVC